MNFTATLREIKRLPKPGAYALVATVRGGKSILEVELQQSHAGNQWHVWAGNGRVNPEPYDDPYTALFEAYRAVQDVIEPNARRMVQELAKREEGKR